MKILFRIAAFTYAALLFAGLANAQAPILIHSHNDYDRNVPFYQAYAQGVASVESDLYYIDGKLLVAHNKEDVKPERTFEALYVEPAVKMFRQNNGHPYKDPSKPLQILVDIKEETEPTMSAIVAALEKYPDVFATQGVRVVITGNRPAPADFPKYPSWIMYDGDVDMTYTEEQLKQIALFSPCFTDYAHWNGKGAPVKDQEDKLMNVIGKVHDMGKPIRFWGAPETLTAYYTFYNYGIDYFNTDNPEQCTMFFSRWGDKNFQIGVKSSTQDAVSTTNKLDKATRDFAGFQHSKLQLSKGIEVYTPTYRSDNADRKIKNVIFLIGDGMGLNQIFAGDYANRGLTMFNMKFVGFQHNNALDQFTTDSAAAGSALATGEKNANRHIASSVDGKEYPSLTDWFAEKGKATGILTLGDVADATPAAFFGHNTERDESDDLTADLLKSKVDIVCGSGRKDFTRRNDGLNLMKELKDKGFSIIDDYTGIDSQKGKVICLDERLDQATNEKNINSLAEATRRTINSLQKMNKDGFFLMVEGAKIDYAGHSMCLPASVLETFSFDLAIAEALKFADEDGETLVVVSADHETGGLVLLDGNRETGRIMGLYFSNDHTPAILPVFAYGPHSAEFLGSYENSDIPLKIKELTK
ncbi:MAG: alkaline phosphatase [Bacteroidales bacterium]|nr:alkaline phosphatase [Candidatus Cacconaster scatequi]